MKRERGGRNARSTQAFAGRREGWCGLAGVGSGGWVSIGNANNRTILLGKESVKQGGGLLARLVGASALRGGDKAKIMS